MEATPLEKQKQRPKNPKQRKTKTLIKEMKQNETGEGRNSKPRWRSAGKRRIDPAPNPTRKSKTAAKGAAREKQKQTRGKTRWRGEAVEAWTSGK
jgi:hypothetical protein